MDDGLLASRAAAGDLESFGQLYDQYLPRVYDFAWRTLGDATQAAEATRDIMLRAARLIRQGTSGVSFSPWLFALAFNHLVPLANGRGAATLPLPVHDEAYGSFDVPDPARLTDPALAGGDHELAALVWESAASLTPRDRALLDLHLRQGLDSAELAGIVGLSKRDAANLIKRMKAAAGGVMGSYVMARRGGANCALLEQAVAPFDIPPLSDAARRSVDGHVKDCTVCSGALAVQMPALEVFGALAAVRAPLELKGDVWSSIAVGWSSPAREVGDAELAAFVGGAVGMSSWGRDGDYAPGYPASTGGGWGRSQMLLFGGAVAGLILFAFGAGFVAVNALGEDDGGIVLIPTATPGSAETATPESSITAGVAVLTATPNRTPSATAVPTETTVPLPPSPTLTPRAPSATPTKPKGTPTRSGVRTATPTRTPKPSLTTSATAAATATP